MDKSRSKLTLEDKIDALDKFLREHMEKEDKNLGEIRVSLARLDEKVATHSKGLSAIGAMLVAAFSGMVTQLFFRIKS